MDLRTPLPRLAALASALAFLAAAVPPASAAVGDLDVGVRPPSNCLSVNDLDHPGFSFWWHPTNCRTGDRADRNYCVVLGASEPFDDSIDLSNCIEFVLNSGPIGPP